MGRAGNMPAPVGSLPDETRVSSACKQAALRWSKRLPHSVGLVARRDRLVACATRQRFFRHAPSQPDAKAKRIGCRAQAIWSVVVHVPLVGRSVLAEPNVGSSYQAPAQRGGFAPPPRFSLLMALLRMLRDSFVTVVVRRRKATYRHQALAARFSGAR